MKKIFAVGALSLMLAVSMAGVASAQTVNSLSPGSAAAGQTVTVTATGTGFAGACTVALTSGTGLTFGTCTVAGATTLSFPLTVGSGAVPGTRTITITIDGVPQARSFGVSSIATPEAGIPGGITTPQGFVDALRTLTDWLFVILVVVAVVMIVLAGLQFITGGGDPTVLSAARTKLIWAAVGIGVALLARGLPEAIRGLLNL